MMHGRFKPNHPYAPALKRLCEKIGTTCSDFQEHGALEMEQFVGWRVVMERNLGWRKREDRE